MKKDLTEIIIIADRSGSMSGTIDEARNAINNLITEQKAEVGGANFTFAMFDGEYDLVKDRVNIKDVEPIGSEYCARGMTAMNDAIGKTINSIGVKLAAEAEEDRPSKVILAIVTDGMENASKEFTQKQIAEILKTQQETYSWEVLFLGADINTVEVGESLNIYAANSIDYDNTEAGVRQAYDSISVRMSEYRQDP